MATKVIVSVTNDLVTDNRVHKVCKSLTEAGYLVVLAGRRMKKSQPVLRSYRTIRFRLWVNQGFLFYATYNLRLFLFLLFTRADILLANDLDVLPANYLVSKCKRLKLVYDSHELFTEVPELIHRPGVRRIWLAIEKFIVPRVMYAYTVCESLADEYKKRYGVSFKVIRNVPERSSVLNSEFDIPLPVNKKIILYQGALNTGRGIERMIRAMKHLTECVFVVAGDGDITAALKRLVNDEQVHDRVIFTGRIPFGQLPALTQRAHVGISLEENAGLNYYYSLPNKIFDYIQAGVPVLCSDFPEQMKIVCGYDVGRVCEDRTPETLVSVVKEMIFNESLRSGWKQNLSFAAVELCWEKEEQILLDLFAAIATI